MSLELERILNDREIQFLLLKRTKFVDFARRRADEGVGLKNNQWPPNIKGIGFTFFTYVM